MSIRAWKKYFFLYLFLLVDAYNIYLLIGQLIILISVTMCIFLRQDVSSPIKFSLAKHISREHVFIIARDL